MIKLSMKQKLITGGAVLVFASVPVALAVNSPEPIGASDDPPIVQEVKKQGEQLDNHEDRITNNEKDITNLQNNTGTAPSSDRVVVRNVTTQSPNQPLTSPSVAPTPPPTPVVDPRTILEVQITDGANSRTCNYKLYNGQTMPVIQPLSTGCLNVGQVLPRI
jgi:hypothetical protein